MKAETTFSLKDRLFNDDTVAALAVRLRGAWKAFPEDAFHADVLSAFPQLELKQRIAHIAAMVHAHLPGGYRRNLGILLDALPPQLDPDLTDDDFGDFILAPLSLYVATHGCTRRQLDVSLDALREMTKRFSAEDAIRSFINAFPAETLAFLRGCARDDHYHVRRLASEGSRPLLPWAQRLGIDYREPIPILDLLFADRTRYVTRSVANHVNDISKLDPELAVSIVARWRDSGEQDDGEMEYMVRHALRTLVRRGHDGAFGLLGFGTSPDVAVLELATDTPRVRVGGAFRFAVKLRSNRRQNLLVDYAMTFAADGRKPGRKVFRLKRLELDAGESVVIEKEHPLRPMTTRRLYAGEHRITLLVNGQESGELAFELILK